jgi:hypothetical protein
MQTLVVSRKQFERNVGNTKDRKECSGLLNMKAACFLVLSQCSGGSKRGVI